eukprot:403368922
MEPEVSLIQLQNLTSAKDTSPKPLGHLPFDSCKNLFNSQFSSNRDTFNSTFRLNTNNNRQQSSLQLNNYFSANLNNAGNNVNQSPERRSNKLQGVIQLKADIRIKSSSQQQRSIPIIPSLNSQVEEGNILYRDETDNLEQKLQKQQDFTGVMKSHKCKTPTINFKNDRLRSIFLRNQKYGLNKRNQPIGMNSGQEPFNQTINGISKTIFQIPNFMPNTTHKLQQKKELNKKDKSPQSIGKSQNLLQQKYSLKKFKEYVENFHTSSPLKQPSNQHFVINFPDNYSTPNINGNKQARIVYVPQHKSSINQSKPQKQIAALTPQDYKSLNDITPINKNNQSPRISSENVSNLIEIDYNYINSKQNNRSLLQSRVGGFRFKNNEAGKSKFINKRPQQESQFSRSNLSSQNQQKRPSTSLYSSQLIPSNKSANSKLNMQKYTPNSTDRLGSDLNYNSCQVIETMKNNINKTDRVQTEKKSYHSFLTKSDKDQIIDRNRVLLQRLYGQDGSLLRSIKDSQDTFNNYQSNNETQMKQSTLILNNKNEQLQDQPYQSNKTGIGLISSLKSSPDQTMLIQRKNADNQLKKQKRELLIHRNVLLKESQEIQRAQNIQKKTNVLNDRKVFKLVFVEGDEALNKPEKKDIRQEVIEYMNYKDKVTKKSHNLLVSQQSGLPQTNDETLIYATMKLTQNTKEAIQQQKPLQFDQEFYDKMAAFEKIGTHKKQVSSILSSDKLSMNMNMNMNEQSVNDFSNTSEYTQKIANKYQQQQTLSIGDYDINQQEINREFKELDSIEIKID